MLLAAGLIALVAVLRPEPPASADRTWYWRHKLEWQNQAQVVLAGNSRVYRGLDPRTIEDASGLGPVLNFGFSGQVWTSEYLDAIERPLAKESPAIIVLAVDPPSLRRQHSPEPGGPARDGYQEASRSAQEAKIPALWEARTDDLLRPFDPIAELRTLSAPRRPAGDRNQYLQEWHLNGWIASDYTKRDPGRYLRNYWTKRSTDAQRVDAETLSRLLARIAAWDQRGIGVIAFRIPTSAETDRFEELAFGYAEGVIRDAMVKAGALWIEVRDKDSLVSYDGSHLARESAMALSRQIGEAIREHLSTRERWR